MRRRITKAEIEELMARLRREIPDIALRTTMLVGFPGETDEDFEELCDFIQRVRFDRVGAFAYSEEEGTPSALHLEDNVPAEVKESRVERLMKIQKGISLALNSERVGKDMRVIIDRTEGEFYIARSQYDSPEVDEEILIPITREFEIGDMVDIRVTDYDEYDLYGEIKG
jgi:ribosomal protein S12 methylthiotransferase